MQLAPWLGLVNAMPMLEYSKILVQIGAPNQNLKVKMHKLREHDGSLKVHQWGGLMIASCEPYQAQEIPV
jgi:hypothetical protein